MFYQNFIGIDIGKFTFVVAEQGTKTIKEYENSKAGITSFMKDHKGRLETALCVLETTGGYEMLVLETLCQKGYFAHRANTRKVKRFIQSYSDSAKTDALDACALARYGYERQASLTLYQLPSQSQKVLGELMARRMDLTQMLVMEKNRLKAPMGLAAKESIKAIIKVIHDQIQKITENLEVIIAKDKDLQEKQEVLRTITGVGSITAMKLTVLLPELGELNRREIASLCGVAPRANDSGKHQGYRRTGHGRLHVKEALFMAAMSASKSKSNLGTFYQNLIERGKKPMVAMTALKRKIIVIANAKIRERKNI